MAYGYGIKLDFNRPGKPVENGTIEIFNGCFWDECLNANVFIFPHDARRNIEAWGMDGNEFWPHGPLGILSPPGYLPNIRLNWTTEGIRFPAWRGLVFGEVSAQLGAQQDCNILLHVQLVEKSAKLFIYHS